MKIKDLYLTEGIIKVPPTLLNKMNQYVASVYCTQLSMKIATVKQIGTMNISNRPGSYEEQEENKKTIIPALTKIINSLQTKYSAKILNSDSMYKLIGSSITVDIPVQEFMSELPKRLQTPEVQANMEKLITRFRISFNTDDRDYAGLSHKRANTGDHLIQITLYDLGDTPEKARQVVNSGFNTVYHEAQHYVQYEVIDFVDKGKKQTNRKDGYSNYANDNTAYYGSSVEFSTTIGDIGHLTIQYLESMKDKGELTGNMNTDVSKAVKDILSSTRKNKIFTALKHYGEINKNNKGLKTIYSMAIKKYPEILSSTALDDSEVDIDTKHDMEIDSDIIDTLYNTAEDAGYNVLEGFSYVHSNKRFSFHPLDNDLYTITLKIDNETFNVSMKEHNTEKYSFDIEDEKQFIQFAKEILGSKTSKYFIEAFEWMEYERTPEVTPDSIEEFLAELKSTYSADIEGGYIILPKANAGIDSYVEFKHDYNNSKEGIMKTYTREITGLSLNDIKELSTAIVKALPKGAELVYKVLNNNKTPEEIIKKLQYLEQKKALDDDDIQAVLDKVGTDLKTYGIDTSKIIKPLKIQFKFSEYIKFYPSTKHDTQVEVSYKGAWHYIDIDDLYDVAYYIIITYPEDPEYIKKILSSTEYSDEEFVDRIKNAHMGEDNYWGL